ncbi:MAG: RelA/SpoT family protein [Erysipelotrichaceae bacterium]
MVVAINKTYEDVMAEVQTYISKPENLKLIHDAYTFAYEMHEGQVRKSGEPYINHAIQVAYVLATLRSGPQTIAAGFLHDVIEDTEVSAKQMIELFGEDVYHLVEAVTKIGNINFADEKEYQANNHRKIFIAMAKDVRVILIKLVDRLHNMRTLQFMSEAKQQKIASETLEVYAPIAHRLGISEIKNELEDLSFYYLNREKYYEIAKLVEVRKAERDEQVQRMINDIGVLLGDHNIRFRMFGRSKHLYSIYKKMVTKQKRFEEILDLLAIRIIAPNETNCYEILGYIHATYRPIPGRFKDYIAMPKVNMYQSLHTTIVADEGNIFEVQIRTEAMDEVAEKGIAAHWKYKENRGVEIKQEEIEEQLRWFKDFNAMSEDVDDDALEYMSLLQRDIFEANVYVMSPKGRVIALPNGATPLDFAYRIHTEIGHKTIGAIVNGALVPLNTVLRTGDVVQIKTTKDLSAGPSKDWLKVVKSSHARNKINAYFQKQEVERKTIDAKKGEEMLAEELKRRNFDAKAYMENKRIESILHSLTYNTVTDLYYAIGIRSIPLSTVIERLTKQKVHVPMDNENLQKMFTRNEANNRKRLRSKSGVHIEGVEGMVISIASCCSPIPGDEIVGFISKGQGVKVHRNECPNIQLLKERLIEVKWDDGFDNQKYEVSLEVHSTDRNFLLSDMVTVVSQCKSGLNHVDSKVQNDKVHVITKMRVIVDNLDHLQMLMANLRKVNSVISVDRDIK